MIDISENWQKVRERVAAAARRSGRESEDIQIVAVTKTVPIAQIRQAIHAGVKSIGENRVQEAWSKYREVGHIAAWHLVGHLQTNKVRRALEIFDLLQSLDSAYLAREINRRCEQMNRTVEVFLEVKTSEEPTKYGVEPDLAIDLVAKISLLPRIKLTGLMTIGKFSNNEVEVRDCFRSLVKLKETIDRQQIRGVSIRHLSMGMSGDFEWAIEEGATMVRIGTAIFGERKYQ